MSEFKRLRKQYAADAERLARCQPAPFLETVVRADVSEEALLDAARALLDTRPPLCAMCVNDDAVADELCASCASALEAYAPGACCCGSGTRQDFCDQGTWHCGS